MLTSPTVEFFFFQSESNLALKAMFQYIREAKILGFEVDSYVDIDLTKLPFSLDDLWYIPGRFQVFSIVSLFNLIEAETKRIKRLHS